MIMEFKRLVFNPVDVNCYILWDETKEPVLIDAAVLFGEEKEELKNFISSNGLTLKYHLNTHLHFDHIFGNPFVEKELGVNPSPTTKIGRGPRLLPSAWRASASDTQKRFPQSAEC